MTKRVYPSAAKRRSRLAVADGFSARTDPPLERKIARELHHQREHHDQHHAADQPVAAPHGEVRAEEPARHVRSAMGTEISHRTTPWAAKRIAAVMLGGKFTTFASAHSREGNSGHRHERRDQEFQEPAEQGSAREF